MFFLDEKEKAELNKIKAVVKNGSTVDQIEKLCSETSIKDKPFPFTYAGVLLAVRDKVDEAKHFFSLNEKDPFCLVIQEYLKEANSFSSGVAIFGNASPYSAWSTSSFCKQYQSGFVTNAYKFAEKNSPPNSDSSCATILDIGTGNGFLIAKVINEIAPLYNPKKVHLILTDPSLDMLKTAKEHCQENIKVPTEIETICCKMQDISAEQIKVIEQARPIWFANISLSLHHIMWKTKLPVFKQIATLASFCLLGDGTWSDELPKDSPELVYITAKAYALIFEDIFNSPASKEDQMAAIYQFLLPEAISILREEIPNRTDYHMSMEDWKKLAEETGFKVLKTNVTVQLKGYPMAFASQWASNNYS